MSINRSLRTWMLATVLVCSITWAAKPEVAFRGALVYPRADLTTADELVWRGQITASHNISERISWYLSGDVTPVTLTRAAGLRVYSGYLKARITPSWAVTAGRQVQWSTLQTTRFDGLSIDRMKGSFGDRRQLSFYAGLIPDDEIRTDYGDGGARVAGGMLKRTSGPSHYSVQIWTNEVNDTSRVYVGGSLRRWFGSRLTQVADLALDIQETALEKVRLRTQVRLSAKISTYLQYRYSGNLTISPYPWITERLEPRNAVSAGVSVTPMKRTHLRMSLVQRLGENAGRYLTAQVTWGQLQFTWQSQDQTIYSSQYMQLSGQHTLFRTMRVGLSAGTGSYALFDNESPAITALALSEEEHTILAVAGWMQGTMGQHLTYRIFGQYAQNRFFKQDGRFGLQVSYAL
ncbi:MAG: hypothetical protein JSW54_11835 [Fidelibacterota bacterium]|nr:MAG: hypothetical protein JSW54_11835 [Candidatus Neomarinimicrobiota bacterium]